MSSRNAYLSETDRKSAPALHESLRAIEQQILSGSREFDALEQSAMEALGDAGFDPDYVAVRRADDLGDPGSDCARFVVLAAAHLGAARLIDNLVVEV